MAIPILNHMDFQKSAEIRNVLLHVTGSGSVSGPGTGQIIYDSGTVKVYNGSSWLSLASGGGTRVVQLDTNGDGSVNNTLELTENLVLKKGSGVSLSETGGVVTIAATGTQLTQEQVEDYAGALVATGGTKTGISVTYDDANGNMDFVIGAGDIVHSMLEDDAIDGDNIGDDVINSEHIAAGAVDTEHIADAQITMAKLANIATDTFIGRTAANDGVPKALSKSEALGILNVADGAQVNVATNLGKTTATGQITITSSTGDNVIIGEATDAIAGLMSVTHHDKLDGIEASATADQTAAEIRTLVGTGNNNFVPAAGSSGEFLKHDGTFGTPSYTTNTDVDVSVANLKTRLAGGFGSNAVTIGDSDDVVTIGNDLVVTGDLTVSGDTITANVGTLDVEDKNITINKSSGDSSSTADGAGITIQDAVDASNDATLLWNASNDKFVFSHLVEAPGTSIFTNLDISGDVDVDGTLEADAITINGTATGALALLDTIATAKIDDDAVTYAKVQNVSATNKILGRVSSGAGVIEELSDSNIRTLINVADGSTANAKASEAEVQAGSNDAKFVTPLQLAQAKQRVQVIDVSSLHSTVLAAKIQHDLGTKQLRVTAQYKGNDSNYEEVIIDWNTTTDGTTESDDYIYVQFASVPSYDITVCITSLQNAKAATGITYPTS